MKTTNLVPEPPNGQNGLVRKTFPITITMAPHELSGNIRGKALQKLHDQLSTSDHVVQILHTDFSSPGVVAPSYGHVSYRINVDALVFEPHEGLIDNAKIVDVRPQGLFLKMQFLTCFLPTLWLSRAQGTINALQKAVTLNGQTYRIGDSLLVKIEKMKERVQALEALVDLAPYNPCGLRGQA